MTHALVMGKFLPSQSAAVFAMDHQIVSLSVQLQLNRLKGRNVWYKAQTVDTVEAIKLT